MLPTPGGGSSRSLGRTSNDQRDCPILSVFQTGIPRAPRRLSRRISSRSLLGAFVVVASSHARTATRPTTDRVREALFSTLGDVSGATVLDLYAGTGALGIEALSRGAERVVMVERARPALDAIAKDLRALDVEKQALVLRCPVERAERKLKEEAPFDLVFIGHMRR